MGLVHGVDAHFGFVPPPTTGTVSFCFSAASMISIGWLVTAARSLAEGAASLFFPVTTLSVTTAWLAFTVVVCCTTICCCPGFGDGRAGGYRGAAEKPPAIIDGTGGLDDRLVADFGLVRASGYNS
jgi:hypothetical protein